MPMWSQQLRTKFKASVAHTFIITGNVRDVVDNRLTLNTYLASMFLQRVNGKRNFDLIIYYDRSNGLRFPTPAMEDLFITESGLSSAPTSAATAGVFAPGTGSNKVPIPKDPATAFKLIEKVLRSDRRAADDLEHKLHTIVVIDYAESLFPAGNWGMLQDPDRDRIVTLLSWAKDPELGQMANGIFLIADAATNLHDSITANSSRIEQLEILLPTPEERLSFIEHLEENSVKDGNSKLTFEDGYNAKKFANQTAGLRKVSLEDIRMTAHHTTKIIGPELVKNRKKEIITSEYQSVIEMIDPIHGFESVGGMEWLKKFFKEDVIKPMLSGHFNRVPMGAAFVGASGTGKTVFAEAIAFEARINMIRLDVGKMLGKYIGDSEAACRKALLAIRSNWPVLVFLDEADQAVNRGSHGDSGVSERIFKMILEAMSDTRNRGKVFWLLATNRVDNLDPALKRPGRIDKIIPFLPPDAKQRAEIFPAVISRYKYETEGKIDFNKFGIETVNWVGSDIEGALVKAYAIACRDDRDKIREADIKQALDSIIPSTAQVEHWTNLALVECNDTDLLPPAHREKFAQKKKEIQRDIDKNKRNAAFQDVPRQTRENLL
jgi:transitional endoplasmic reticulum ATPase